MGQPAPAWDGPFGDHVRNDFARSNEPWIAVRRPLPGAAVRAEFVEVAETRLAQLDVLTEDEWAAVGWSPLGERPRRGVHGGPGLRQLGARAGRAARPRPSRGGAATRRRPSRSTGCKGPWASSSASRPAAPRAPRCASTVAGPHRDARAFTVAVQDGRAREVGDDVAPTVTLSISSLDFVRLGCGRVGADELEAAGTIGVDGDAASGRARARRHELHALNRRRRVDVRPRTPLRGGSPGPRGGR